MRKKQEWQYLQRNDEIEEINQDYEPVVIEEEEKEFEIIQPIINPIESVIDVRKSTTEEYDS